MEPDNRGEYARNTFYTIMAGQAGCSSVIMILGALLLGLWLDSMLGTRPAFTLGLILLSIPVSLFFMVYMVLKSTSQITPPKVQSTSRKRQSVDED
jgi:F0F1-type ATP synthase assembly protein I